MTPDSPEPAVGQCLVCGGRGGWWSGEKRTPCGRCVEEPGWDPDRNEPWFVELVAPLQGTGGSVQ